MSETVSFKPESINFDESVVRKRVEACAETLHVFESTNSDFARDVRLKQWSEIVGYAKKLAEEGRLELEESDLLCRVTVGVVDVMFVDEIAAKTGGKESKEMGQMYARGVDNVMPKLIEGVHGEWQDLKLLPFNEGVAYLDMLKKVFFDGSMQSSLTSLSDRLGVQEQVGLEQLVTEVQDISEVVKCISDEGFAKDQAAWGVMVPVRIGRLIGFVNVTKVVNKGWIQMGVSSPYYQKIITDMPRQDMWYELLREGLSLGKIKEDSNFGSDVGVDFSGKRLDELIDNYVKDNLVVESGSDAIIPRKVQKIWLNPEVDYAELKQAHIAFYEREFGRSIDGKVAKVTLTRSGVSALGLAIKEAEGFVKDMHESVFTVEGWYPENNPKRENRTEDINRSRVLLINHESNPPFCGGEEVYAENRRRILGEFLARVRNNSNEKFALVYDKTLNLNACVDFGELGNPDNLLYLEAASLTKHQRGQRHGFYGAVWSYGDDRVDEELLIECNASPTEYTLATFPHITAVEHRQVNERFARCSEKIRELFKEMLGGTGWNIETYGYYYFILPPYQKMFDMFLKNVPIDTTLVEEEDILDQRTGVRKLFYAEINNGGVCGVKLDKVYAEWLEEHKEKVEEGDSFGLEKIRLTNFYMPIDLIGFPGGLIIQEDVGRISYGLGISEDDTVNIAGDLFGRIQRRIKF